MNLRRRSRGFSLVELSAVLIALGLVSVLLARFLGTAQEQQREEIGRDLLQRADDALLAFAMVHSRLPCPDNGVDGNEDCSAGQVGRLPWRTIGLPDARARLVRYGVLRRPDLVTARFDADLGTIRDRFHPLVVVSSDTATLWPIGNSNGLDMCWALRNALEADDDPAFVHVVSPSTASGITHVAYAVALPRADHGFGGEQAAGGVAFDAPRRGTEAGYHDRVLAVGLDQLWARMHCGDNIAAAGFAHFNSAATIALMHKSMLDYKKELEVALKMAEANTLNAGAAVAGGVAGVADAAGGVADTVSEGLASTGVVGYRVAIAAVATAAAVGVTITAGVMLGYAISAEDSARQAYADIDPQIDAAEQLSTESRANAEEADALGLY